MGIQVYETPESPVIVGGENPSVELRCKVEGTSDSLVARMALLWFTPPTHSGLVRQTPRIEPDGDSPDVWAASVQYGLLKPRETGDSTYQFDTGGGTQHITHSIKTVGKYAAPGKTAPDFKGAIGVTLDNVEGVDITVPVYHFSETHYLAAATGHRGLQGGRLSPHGQGQRRRLPRLRQGRGPLLRRRRLEAGRGGLGGHLQVGGQRERHGHQDRRHHRAVQGRLAVPVGAVQG